jgi:multiple sugar transport system ATP-binding protein
VAEIVIDRVVKMFGKVPAVDGVSLTIEDGEFMVLLGPSGCGKTTLLRCLAGLEMPDAGRILIGGQDITNWPPRKRNIAMVFQNYAVFPHMTVFENVAFGLRMQKRPSAEVQRRVHRAAEMLQVEPYLDRHPAQLSGGQRQRVAVARAIVMDPAVLLMDEPLSNLDALLRMQMRAELKRLLHDIQATTAFVTHDQVEALSMGDRIAVMRSGRIQQVDAPLTVYTDPANTFVGGFIGNPPMNFLRGRIEANGVGPRVNIEGAYLAAPAGLVSVAGQEVLVGLRAENMECSVHPVAGAMPARVMVVEPLGSHQLLTLRMGEQTLKVVTPTDFPVAPDRDLWLRPDPAKLRWLDPGSGAALRVSDS